MPIFHEHFYHKTISLYCGVFGSVFNDMKIVRQNGTIILVPIAYQIKQTYDVRGEQNPDPDQVRYKMQLPRLAFKLTGLQKDTSRSTSRYNQLAEKGVDRETAPGIMTQFNRVPYVFSFELAAKTKTMDDLLQILEQIVVYFNPTLRVIVEDNPDLNQDSAITIRLMDQNVSDIVEGTFDGDTALELTFNFELEGYLYMPTTPNGIIKTITLNYFDFTNGNLIDTEVIQ